VSLTESWPARTFSLTNAKDARPGELAHLLRRLANRVEALNVDLMSILDLTGVDGDHCEWTLVVRHPNPRDRRRRHPLTESPP